MIAVPPSNANVVKPAACTPLSPNEGLPLWLSSDDDEEANRIDEIIADRGACWKDLIDCRAVDLANIAVWL